MVAPLAQSRRAIASIAAFSTWIMVIFKPDGAHGMYSWPHVLLATAVRVRRLVLVCTAPWHPTDAVLTGCQYAIACARRSTSRA